MRMFGFCWLGAVVPPQPPHQPWQPQPVSEGQSPRVLPWQSRHTDAEEHSGNLGQNAGYVIYQLRDFKSGARKNDMMSPIAAGLGRLPRDATSPTSKATARRRGSPARTKTIL